MYKHVSQENLLAVNRLVSALSESVCIDEVTGEEVSTHFHPPYTEFSLGVQLDEYSRTTRGLSKLVEISEKMMGNARTGLDEMTSRVLRQLNDTCRRILVEMSSGPV